MKTTAMTVILACILLNAFDVPAQQVRPPAFSIAGTTWAGTESLGGFGKLSFRFDADGTAVMSDIRSTVKGKWLQNGDRLTITFSNCEYIGRIQGDTISGSARFTAGRQANWTFSVNRMVAGAQRAGPLYQVARIPDFREAFSLVVNADRVALRDATGREESVPSGRPGHAIPEPFLGTLQGLPDFNAKRGPATSARTSLFDDSVHVQVYEGGGMIHELAGNKYYYFWHARRTTVGVDEPFPPGEIIAYRRVPGLTGNYGMIIHERGVMLIDHAGGRSHTIAVAPKSYPVLSRVQTVLESNRDLVKRFGGALSEDASLFDDALRVQVFDGGVLVHESAGGGSRAAWHTPRGWAPTLILQPPTTIARGDVLRPSGPAKTLTHPSGARVDIPAGAISKASKPFLETITKHPPVAPFVSDSPVYRIQALTIQNTPLPITIDLPAGKARDRAVVLVLNAGRWLRVPSSSIAMPDGQPGQRVRLVGVSFPWTVTVVGVPPTLPLNRGLVKGTTAVGQLLRLEQLRWTDPAAFAAAVRQPDVEARSERSSINPRLAFITLAQAPPRPAEPDTLFFRAQSKLLKANPDAHTANKDAVALYLQGIEYLWQARNAYDPAKHSQRTDYDRVVDPETKELVLVGSSWRLDQIIEQYCGRYCPWGVQLMLEFARKGELNPDQFDLRVIPEYGSKLSTDVVLREDDYIASRLPWTALEATQDKIAESLKIPKGKAHRRAILRFWSPQVMDWQVADIINIYKEVKGWSSWLVALGTLAVFPEGGVTIGVVYQAGMPVLENLILNDLLGEVQAQDRSMGLVAGMGYENINELGGWITEGEDIVTRGHLKDVYTNLFMAWWLEYFQFDLMNNLREASDGASGYANHAWEEGVSNFRVPPIMLMANVWGPTKDSRSTALRAPVYPQGAQALIAWTPDYRLLASRGERGYDLHDAFVRRSSERFAYSELNSCWKEFRRDEWVYWNYDSDPIEQQVKFRLDTKRLEAAAAARNVSVERLLKDLIVEVRAGDAGSTALFLSMEVANVTLEQCFRSRDDTTHWFALRIHGKLASWRKSAEVPENLRDEAYTGPVFEGSYRPHRHYTITLKAKKDREPTFVLPVTFDFKAGETERRTDVAEKSYVDRTTAKEEAKLGQWYLARPVDPSSKDTAPYRIYFEPQGARANTIVEFPIPDNRLSEWTKLSGLGKRVYLTAELDSQAKPPHYLIRDAKLTEGVGKIVKNLAFMGAAMADGWENLPKLLVPAAKPPPTLYFDVAVHDLFLTVVPEGPNLRIRGNLDVTITFGKKSQRQKAEGWMLAVPEK